MEDQDDPHANMKHASPSLVLLILFVATLVEISAALMPGFPKNILVPVLMGITFVKFTLVALYYMHLRYEKAIYGVLFVAPLFFALLLGVIVLPLP